MVFLLNAIDLDPADEAAVLDRHLSDIAAGNRDAFAALYSSTGAAVYSFALSILKNTHDAEDVLQDAFLHIHSAAESYRSQGKPMAWILRITRNLALQKLRQQQKQADIPREDWEPYLAACENLSAEDRLIVAECMYSLSEEERQIVILHAVAGYKHREIADLLDLALPTVLSKYHRALKKLRTQLAKGETGYDR